jgi:hypothetical protein
MSSVFAAAMDNVFLLGILTIQLWVFVSVMNQNYMLGRNVNHLIAPEYVLTVTKLVIITRIVM